jgi:6-phosphofructokinase 1
MHRKPESQKNHPIKTLAVLTSGGDAPGMNCAVRAVVRTAIGNGLKTKLVYDGYEGLIEGEIRDGDLGSVGGIINLGGTVLGTARCEEFRQPEGRKKAMENIRKHKIDALVVIGGDGSFRGADALTREFNLPTCGIPGTIDNDIAGTDHSIGFDTALNTALDAIDKIRDTATSHERLFVVEVMGREAGFLALETAIAGGAEAALIPEVPYDIQKLCERIEKGIARGKRSSIIVLAEGAGSCEEISYKIRKTLGLDLRGSVIGHIQRGGSPTALDRIVSAQLGKGAVETLLAGEYGRMVGLISGEVKTYQLSHAWKAEKKIDPDLLRLAEILAL